MRRGDDLVAGLNLQRGHGKIERVGPVGAGHAMLDIHRVGKFPFERVDIWSANERIVANDSGDRGIDLALDGLVLKLQIGEGHRHRSLSTLAVNMNLAHFFAASRRAGLPA